MGTSSGSSKSHPQPRTCGFGELSRRHLLAPPPGRTDYGVTRDPVARPWQTGGHLQEVHHAQ